MQNLSERVVVLGTGGTIAGSAERAADTLGYRAGQIPAARLVEDIVALAGGPIEAQQIAQIDSKDMVDEVWLALAQAVHTQLERPDVAGVVVTHGTDTLEETAYFLQRVLAPSRPVVLVGAMRPATSLQADGPQNLCDAVQVARSRGARGVVAVLAGTVYSAWDVRKVHPYRLEAFDAGDAGPVARLEAGRLRMLRDWPVGQALGLPALRREGGAWPWVEILTSHAGARAAAVSAWVAGGVRGIVVAGTGNGSVHAALEGALVDARAAGVVVWRSTRCQNGEVLDAGPVALPSAGTLTPVQARIELMLRLTAGIAA